MNPNHRKDCGCFKCRPIDNTNYDLKLCKECKHPKKDHDITIGDKSIPHNCHTLVNKIWCSCSGYKE